MALDGEDLAGYDVEATDGSIGTVDEASPIAGRAYIVVDIGFWIVDRKRLIPAGIVQRVDHEAYKVFVSLSKGQIERAPDFDESGLESRVEYDAYYGNYAR